MPPHLGKGHFSLNETIARFWRRVSIKEGDCWEWQGALTKAGYGHFGYGYRDIMAHRFAYELVLGKIDSEQILHHKCHNPKCVNPDHLESLTIREHLLKGNTLMVKALSKTHCPQGHPYDMFNTVIRRGARECHICVLARKREWSKRKYRHA